MGEDPSNFAIKLETLAVKAFGNMGQVARLRLIRDRFIAGHTSLCPSGYPSARHCGSLSSMGKPWDDGYTSGE